MKVSNIGTQWRTYKLWPSKRVVVRDTHLKHILDILFIICMITVSVFFNLNDVEL